MIRIFNIRTSKSIKIELDSDIFLFPNDYYEDNPHVKILMAHFNFVNHTSKCDDCKAFLNSFGSDSTDWYIEYLDKTRRLNLELLGDGQNDNHCIYTISDFFNGTELKLNIDTDTIDSLKQKLEDEIAVENYEGCIIISKKINSLGL